MSNLYDDVSESIFLSGIAKNPDKLADYDGRFISPTDFFRQENAKLYNILKHIVVQLNTKSIDEYMCVCVAKELGIPLTKKEVDALNIVLSRNVSMDTMDRAAKDVKKCAVKRFLQATLESEANTIEDAEGSVSSIIGGVEDRIYKALNNLGPEESDLINLTDNAFDFVEGLIGKETLGLNLGYPAWEKDVGKIRNGSVHGIFARMKQGKSQMGLNLIIRAALRGIPTLILDTELGEQLNWIRLVAQAAKIPYDLVEEGGWTKNPEYVQRFKEAKDFMKGKPIIYGDIAGKTIDIAVNHIRKFALKYNKNPGTTPKVLVLYDYVKLPDISEIGAAKEYQILGAISSKLHDEAIRLKLPIIMIGQQNRSAVEEDSLTTIADSDKIARDIDSVTVIRRKTERELKYDDLGNGSHILKVLAARAGPGHVGDEYINLFFNMSCGDIQEGGKFTYDKLKSLQDNILI